MRDFFKKEYLLSIVSFLAAHKIYLSLYDTFADSNK